MEGLVYAFVTLGIDESNNRVFKIGRTTNWEQRRAFYTGLDAPDDSHPLIVHPVQNCVIVETTLKRCLSEMFERHSGFERFLVPLGREAQVLRWIESTILLHPQRVNTFGMTNKRVHDLIESDNCKQTRKSSMTPQSMDTWKTVREVVRHWFTVIAPMERSCQWRTTKALGTRKEMRRWGHQINHNYYPVLFRVLDKCSEDDTTIFEAVDALDQEKSALSWTDFMAGYCLRSDHPNCSVYTEQLMDRDDSLAGVCTMKWKAHISL